MAVLKVSILSNGATRGSANQGFHDNLQADGRRTGDRQTSRDGNSQPQLKIFLTLPPGGPHQKEIMMNSRKYSCRNILAALVLALGLIVPGTKPLAQSNGNPGVIPPNARPYGLSYGDWSAKWWQWALSIPAATNPLPDTTGANCAEGQTERVWFLAGTFGGSATRTCTIPPGRAIFFPTINIVFGSGVFDCDPTNPGVPCDVAALRKSAAAVMDNPITLEAEVDGRSLQNLNAYRAFSPVFSITHPSDSVFGVPAGTYTPQIPDGYWIMLAPLSAGTHTIHFKGAADFFGTPFGTEVTYHLAVGQ